MNLDQKDMKLEVKLAETEGPAFEFDAIATTFGNVDRDGDIIEAGAFDEGLKKVHPKLLWQHDSSQPIGNVEDIVTSENMIKFRGTMPKDDTFVAGRVVPQLRHGSLDISIGFVIHESEWIGSTRVISKGTLYEFSPVSIPANPFAVVTDVKSVTAFQDLQLADKGHYWDEKQAFARLKERAADGMDYSKAFVCLNPDAQAGIDAYRMQIGDVIDGEIKVVRYALFAAAAAIQGTKSGADVPIEERAAAIKHLEHYYTKMGRESPFKSGFGPAEIKAMSSIADLKTFMRSRPPLSGAAAEFIAQKLLGGPGRAAEIDGAGLHHLTETLKELEMNNG